MAKAAKKTKAASETSAKKVASKSATSRTVPKQKKKVASTQGQETNILRRVSMRPKNPKINDFKAGDTVNVFVKVIEGEKERVQVYKGMVIKIQGAGAMKSFTVRKISAGIGVERTFPFGSPAIDSVEVLSYGKVRRSKLYYLRNLDGKAARIESELAVQEKAEA